jgi:hypothetical protein
MGYGPMSDRVKLACAIAARTEPRFIDTNPKRRPQTIEGMRKLARAIAARSEPRFIEIPRERGGGKVHFTEEQLTGMRGGLTVEEYRPGWVVNEPAVRPRVLPRTNAVQKFLVLCAKSGHSHLFVARA